MLQIVSDSSCDLPDAVVEEHCIHLVPLTISVGGKEYLERVDLTPEEFYDKMAAAKTLPKTAQPAPGVFAQVFEEKAEMGEVLCLTLSSGLSGTYQSACIAKELVKVPVTVFDTLAGTLGHGLQVLKACKMARAGCTMEEVVAELTNYRERMKILILLNTLENIVKGGRLSKFQGTLAGILNIKLLLHNVKGEVEMLERVRGSKKFMRRVLEVINECCPDLSKKDVGITNFRNLAGSERFVQALKADNPPRSILTNSMGATFATYAGEGGIIISF